MINREDFSDGNVLTVDRNNHDHDDYDNDNEDGGIGDGDKSGTHEKLYLKYFQQI